MWKYDLGGHAGAGRPCLSLCLLAVAKASVGSSLAVLPAWLLEGAPCPGHQHLAHLAQAAELAAFPVVPLFFPAVSATFLLGRISFSSVFAVSSLAAAAFADNTSNITIG